VSDTRRVPDDFAREIADAFDVPRALVLNDPTDEDRTHDETNRERRLLRDEVQAIAESHVFPAVHSIGQSCRFCDGSGETLKLRLTMRVARRRVTPVPGTMPESRPLSRLTAGAFRLRGGRQWLSAATTVGRSFREE